MTRRLCNPSVRRQLFPEDDVTSEAVKDNSSNLLREIIATDTLRMMQKWNFDTENDRQLDKDGPIEWVAAEGKYSWIGIIKTAEHQEKKNTKDAILKMKEKNEETPKVSQEDGARFELLRKRKKNEDKSVGDKVKRKISFD